MTSKLTLPDLPVQNKKVLMRVDFNVPLDKEGNITDDTRIVASLPSIKYVLENGGSLILMSHLGRPKGQALPNLTLAPCAKRLSELLNQPVEMLPDCIGEKVKQIADQLKPGEIILLENLRFHTAEEKPEQNPDFVQYLAALGDLYVNDAFGTSHRSHSSTTKIAKFFPGKAAAGFLLQKEIQFLGDALLNPKRPFYAIIGGAKVSTKLGALKALIDKVDGLFIGGGMAYTFLKAQGISIGESICEDEFLEEAKKLLKTGKIHLPSDIVVTEKLEKGADHQIIKINEGIPSNMEGVDIGPDTIVDFGAKLKDGVTILWNGPLGVFEISPFDKGTNAIAHILTQTTAVTIVGGGDSVAALKKANLAEKITHISTGGGASLEYIEFGTLPGIEALSDKKGLTLIGS